MSSSGNNNSPISGDPSSLPFTLENSSSTPTSTPIFSELEIDGDCRKRKLTSDVWNHYKRKKIDGKDKAQCNYCQILFLGDPKQGTSHLHEHLKICPRKKNYGIKDMRQRILISEQKKAELSQTSLGIYHFDENVSRQELAKMIMLHEFPLSVVEYVGFRSFVHSRQPLFKMVSRNTIKKDILKIYEHEKTKVYMALEKQQSRVAITTDMWRSSNKKRGFMVVTSHFIDDSWTMQNHILSSGKKVENVKLELDYYLEDGVLPRTNDFEILSWWKNHGIKYPTLRLIARDVLAIHVTTVASESAFSTSGRLLSPHRSRLTPQTVKALMCAQNWLWNEIRGSSNDIPENSTFQTILDENDDIDEESEVVEDVVEY